METDTRLPPVVPDLSAYIISGAVSAEQRDVDYESDSRTPAQGIQDAVDAERIGFRAVFLSERWDIKEAAVVLPAHPAPVADGGVRGDHAGLPRPPVHPGGGVGTDSIWRDMGRRMTSYRELADYVDILRRLWRGETVSYDGPVGRFPALSFSETVPGPPPPVWFGTFAKEKGAELLASSFDGVVLPPVLTPEATAKAVARIRATCERIGRDPASIRVSQAGITAPDLEDLETRSLAHGRAVGYLQYPGYGETLVEENGWDPAVLPRLRAHRQLASDDKVADRRLHRHQLLEPAKLIPDKRVTETCAIGSVDECVTSLRRFREAGADEISTYGSTPAQNAKLVEAWRAGGER